MNLLIGVLLALLVGGGVITAGLVGVGIGGAFIVNGISNHVSAISVPEDNNVDALKKCTAFNIIEEIIEKPADSNIVIVDKFP